MKIGLASKEFINNDIQKNTLTIIETMKEAKENKAQMICFGEAFLQGFDSLSWNYAKDKVIAITKSSLHIKVISKFANDLDIAVSFGYIENDNDLLYCSYIAIDNTGNIIHNFKRVSPGWKESCDFKYYKEGTELSTFAYKDLTFAIGLCGDFWYEENIVKVSKLKKDVVLWPLFVDFAIEEFEKQYKEEYAKQVKPLGSKVLFINSICKKTPSFGGCLEFLDGNILSELPIGNEGILYIEI
ncbi:carbon-nitrogen hydrolase family protein [Clostridium sp. B9]|uniref:carbon-nitrogen hydrolase family protein n=1 Tax=Clostridium sp. B9 TaxID=3423224 RepID=UPI003D2EF4B1